MTVPNQCCAPCPTVETVEIPGPEGADGTPGVDGTNGLNAFTATTADFLVPAIGDQVTISVGDSSWMAVGEPIFVEGAGIFQVVSIPVGGTTAVVEYLNYVINTNSGNTVVAGATVTPSGTQPTVTLLPGISNYAVGGSQALTTTPAQLLSVTVTLTETKTYLLFGRVRYDFVAATFPASHVANAKLRRTNNTPGDITNCLQDSATGVVTLESATFQIVTLPPVLYAATAGDIVQLFGSLDVAPYSGAVQAISGSILAIPMI